MPSHFLDFWTVRISDILTKKYSMKAIPETRGEHQIRYLGFRIIRLLIISLVSSTFLTFLFILLRIGECPSLIINQINKVQWVDFKLENVLVSLHSLKTMDLGP
jgi:hypothetical protein